MRGRRGTIVGPALRGATAGLVAPTAMGLLMLAARRVGLVDKLAPEQITEAGLDVAGAAGNDRAEDAASTAAHLAYGATNGVLFAFVSDRLPGSPMMRGLAFAAVLLLLSYEGWVPAARILPPREAMGSTGCCQRRNP